MGATVTRIGNVELTALIDCTASVAAEQIFPNVAKDAWEPFCEFLIEDCTTIPLTIPSFVLRSGGKMVLIDSGMGAKSRRGMPNGRLPDAMADAGIRPAEIDIVFATHIHIDHVGWHTTAKDGSFVPTFPNARHIFVREEYEYFTSKDVVASGQAPWVADCVLPLEGVVPIDLVDAEYMLTDDLTLIPTPGHTPAHSAVAIVSDGESAVIIGDVCHHPAQMLETSWSPVFDLNPALAAESREKLMRRIEEQQMRVIGGHFAHPGFGRLVRVEGRRTWVPG